MTQLEPIPAQELDGAMAVVRPFIENMCEASNGEFSPGGLVAELRRREKQLWALFDDRRALGIVVTWVAAESVWVFGASGKGLPAYADHIDTIESWAREMGARRVHLYARRGWTPTMKKLGYRPTHTIMDKEL